MTDKETTARITNLRFLPKHSGWHEINSIESVAMPSKDVPHYRVVHNGGKCTTLVMANIVALEETFTNDDA